MAATPRSRVEAALANARPELVVRVQRGVYLVPSATVAGESYVVTGTGSALQDYLCDCPAALHGHPCWHTASVLRRRQQEATRRPAAAIAA